MNGFYLATIQVRRPRRCAHCQYPIEYVRYVKVVHHFYPVHVASYKPVFYLALAGIVLAVGISMAFVYHWPLAFLLVLVWLATAIATSQLLASDMRQLRHTFVLLDQIAHALSLWVAIQGRNVRLFLQKHKPKRARPVLIKGSRVLMPMKFPETPMPATPLIRVLETIDLSSTSIEHFLEEERQTSGELPIVYEGQQKIGQSLSE